MKALLLILIDAVVLHRRGDQRTDYAQASRAAFSHLPLLLAN
jgi:hypothetical protein